MRGRRRLAAQSKSESLVVSQRLQNLKGDYVRQTNFQPTQELAALHDSLHGYTESFGLLLQPHLEKTVAHYLQTMQIRDPLQKELMQKNPRDTPLTVPKHASYQTCIGLVESIRTDTYHSIFGHVKYIGQAVEYYSYDEAGTEVRQTSRRRLVFVPSSWLAYLGIPNAFDLCVNEELGTRWKATLELPRLVPDDAQIFQYCKTGNVHQIQSLFSERAASVSDVNSQGQTPLHIAAQHHRVQVCQLLIKENANVEACDWTDKQKSPFCKGCKYSCSGPAQLDTLRVLIGGGFDLHGAQDIEEIFTEAHFSSVFHPQLVGGPGKDTEHLPSWIQRQMVSSLPSPDYLHINFWYYQAVLWLMYSVSSFFPSADHPLANARLCDLGDLAICISSHLASVVAFAILDLNLTSIEPALQSFVKFYGYVFTRLGTLNEVLKYAQETHRDSIYPSPTRAAMNTKRNFALWVTVLQELEIDLNDFAVAEARLLTDGWTSETLLEMLQGNYGNVRDLTSKDFNRFDCRQCNRTLKFRTEEHDPSWEIHINRIKSKQDVDAPYDEVELDLVRRGDRYEQAFLERDMCYGCFTQMECGEWEENHKAEESIPGLLDIEI